MKATDKHTKKAAAARRKYRIQLAQNSHADRVSGCHTRAIVYTEEAEANQKVSVMTGKFELKPDALRKMDVSDELVTGYGRIYTSTLNRADQLQDNIRGTEIFNHDGSLPVYVKRVADKNGATKSDISCFTKEAAALKELKHANVLLLYGFITHFDEDGVSMSMVFEYNGQGNLKKFLDMKRTNAASGSELYNALPEGVVPVSPASKISMAYDIATGIQFLIDEVHASIREMAAHLCSLSDDGVVRIGDFGQARKEFPDAYSSLDGAPKQLSFPVRWMAPESVKDFTEWGSSSTVWSFAVTVWEIAMLGETPFGAMDTSAARKQILSGTAPNFAKCDMPTSVTKLLEACFAIDPSERPDFAGIKGKLDDIIAQEIAMTNGRPRDLYTAGYGNAVERKGEAMYKTLVSAEGIGTELLAQSASVRSTTSAESSCYGAVITGTPAAKGSPLVAQQPMSPMKPEEPDYEYSTLTRVNGRGGAANGASSSQEAAPRRPSHNEAPPTTPRKSYGILPGFKEEPKPVVEDTDMTYEVPEVFEQEGDYEVPVDTMVKGRPVAPGGTIKYDYGDGNDAAYELPEVFNRNTAGQQTYDDLAEKPKTSTVSNPAILPGMKFDQQNAQYELERQRRIEQKKTFAAPSKSNDSVDLFDQQVPKLAMQNLPSGLSTTVADEDDIAAALLGLGALYKEDKPEESQSTQHSVALEATIEKIEGAPPSDKPEDTQDKLARYKEKMISQPEYYTVGRFKTAPPAAKLRAACKKGYYELVGEILKDENLVIDGARKGGSGKTALHHAAGRGFLKIVKMLLNAGANPFVVDSYGLYPLDYATQDGRRNVMKEIRQCMMQGAAQALGEEYIPEEEPNDAAESTESAAVVTVVK